MCGWSQYDVTRDRPRLEGRCTVANLTARSDALDVHVQQITGARPLLAHHRRALAPRRARAAVTLEDRADRRIRHARLVDQQPRAPAGAPARLADALLDLGRGAPRRVMRPAGAVQRPRPARALGAGCLALARRPVVRRRRRDREGGRGRPLKQSVLTHQANQRDAASRSELAHKVLTHPGPPSRWIPGRTHSLRSGPDVFAQALTTSLGRSARR